MLLLAECLKRAKIQTSISSRRLSCGGLCLVLLLVGRGYERRFETIGSQGCVRQNPPSASKEAGPGLPEVQLESPA